MEPIRILVGIFIIWILYAAWKSHQKVLALKKQLAQKDLVTGTWNNISKTANKLQFPWNDEKIPWWISSPFAPYYGYRNAKNKEHVYWTNTPYYKHYWYRPHYIAHGYNEPEDKEYHHYHQPPK